MAGGAAGLTSEMAQYSVLDRAGPEEGILAAANGAGFGVLVRGAVAGGLFGGTTPAPYLDTVPGGSPGCPGGPSGDDGSRRRRGPTAVRFVLGHSAVTAVVAGASTAAELEATAAAADAPPLDQAELTALREAVRALRYTNHR